MSETKYLYGASVQGIQGFIFQTNDLKDIVGASELVEQICTNMFDEFMGSGQIVVKAAGNIKCIFEDKAECEKAVRYFPKKVMEAAPGVTISQAVVPMKNKKEDFEKAVEELERLLHVQRNKPLRNITYGGMAVMRSRTTGLPAVDVEETKDGTVFFDEGTLAKRRFSNPQHTDNTTMKLAEKSFGIKGLYTGSVAFDIEKITDKNDWIAVIHADGNGLGQIVAQKNKDPHGLQIFSDSLDIATKKSAQQAFADIIKAEDYNPTGKVIPFRPVVLGGDDMTVICRASLAMRYVVSYIKHFEDNTKKMVGQMLTACAGIAYIKSSYPFHYGYRLAEALCEEAKKDAKKPEHLNNGLAPSCIMFHKIQGSYIGSFSQIEQNELTIKNRHDEGKYSLEFGPYYLNKMEDRWTVSDLRNNTAKLVGEDGNAAKSDIRQWLTLMNDAIAHAEQKEKRVNAISSGAVRGIFNIATNHEQRGDTYVYPAYDMLQLLTVETQITKEEDKK